MSSQKGDSNASLVCEASAYPEATRWVDIEVGQHAGVRVGSILHPAQAYLRYFCFHLQFVSCFFLLVLFLTYQGTGVRGATYNMYRQIC